jgi:general L-amino acid transport system permease protein
MSDIQAQTDLTFVRQEVAAAEAPPRTAFGPVAWLQRNLFASVGDTLLTLFGVLIIVLAVPPLLDWALFSAVWEGDNREVCISPEAGACWAFVKAKFAQFMYGRYPIPERWRVDLVFLLLAAGLVPMMIPSVPHKGLNAAYLFGIFPVVGLILLTGGDFDISPSLFVTVALFGGLAVAFVAMFSASGKAPLLTGGAIPLLAALAVGAYVASFFFGRQVGFSDARVNLFYAVFGVFSLAALAAAIVPMAASRSGRGALAGVAVAVAALVALIAVLRVDFGLTPVETPLWGGLTVTLVVSYVGIVAALPLGILLALGRRSRMPVVRTLSIAFIELWRGVPLITVLFMASVMLPLFLPPGMTFDKLLRALIGVALFSAAYMAEVVRGGLQAIPKGQYEAAQALGLGYWRMMRLIVLPQALKIVIPGIVNTFIGLFKDTSLVSIIGLFDLLGIVRQNFADTNWASWQTPATGLVFAAFVFWLFCFGMSRYSQFIERRLATGHKR